MARHLNDETIRQLLVEAKPLPPDFLERLQVKPKHGHKESEMDVTGNGGSEFRVILRQSNFNPLDFSIILAYRPPKTNQLFRLRRYNGKSHEHRNMIEGNTFYDFHVHTATQRYQEAGLREDWFAEQTDRFAEFHEALKCLLEDCGFVVPANAQGRLFS